MIILFVFITVCILVAVLFKTTRKMISIIVVFILVIMLLPIFSDTFKFNLITGGEHLPSSSSSKEEAIEREVYVGDVRLPYSPYKINDTLVFEITDGWIEKSWRSSYWYWTTLPDDGYTICLNASSTNEKNKNWVIRNNKSSSTGYEQLGFYNGQFGGSLEKLPESDTLKYTVLKENNLDFSEKNIIGELELLLSRK